MRGGVTVLAGVAQAVRQPGDTDAVDRAAPEGPDLDRDHVVRASPEHDPAAVGATVDARPDPDHAGHTVETGIPHQAFVEDVALPLLRRGLPGAGDQCERRTDGAESMGRGGDHRMAREQLGGASARLCYTPPVALRQTWTRAHARAVAPDAGDRLECAPCVPLARIPHGQEVASNDGRRGRSSRPVPRAVQCVEAEIDFVDETFKERCAGGAPTCCARTSAEPRTPPASGYAGASPTVAIGVDLDAETLAGAPKPQPAPARQGRAERVQLLQRERARRLSSGPVDALLAMNFSYYIFTERDLMRGYFKSVRESLVDDGVFFLDAYGGYNSFKECQERTENDDFTYVWDQAAYDPISGEMTCHIHFTFPDGSRTAAAPSPTTGDCGRCPRSASCSRRPDSSRSPVYWQGTDEETGEASGSSIRPSEEGDPIRPGSSTSPRRNEATSAAPPAPVERFQAPD